MKKLMGILCLLAMGTFTMQAQENKDIQQKTIVKKVTMTDNDKVVTKVVEETKADIDVIEVEENGAVNQEAKVITKNADKTAVVAEANEENTTNKAMVAVKKKTLENDLEASKKAEFEKAEAEKAALAAKKKELEAQMLENRKKLESRPKGMAKLKKDN
ncbi:MAG: hypothetical protein OQJ83_04125 [Altibacter sp.]|uniref:hypothetical protein n=1 Tax=Altibacter lentus TaxID=1223410 RepID=UPI00054F4146|nr:hypothetical protein [Altibacter lentus]MCW8980552.1 hypothetical protein [Altibacter sp.]